MKLLPVLLTILLLINPAFASQDYEIVHWGKIIKVPEKQVDQFFGYSYLLSVKKGEQVFGYPIEPGNKQVESLVQKNKGRFVKVEGKIGKRKTRGVENNQSLDVIYLNKLESFALSNLKVEKNKKTVLDQNLEPVPAQKPIVRKRGKGVSDKVTNAVLFGAGALLMGNLIKTMVDK
ncbi:MAG: hypothetical protein KC493_03630 [Bacteriovoracaceae bacterium]|nr:hypothetical protein [Bacteriovoracaceae bacterium]